MLPQVFNDKRTMSCMDTHHCFACGGSIAKSWQNKSNAQKKQQKADPCFHTQKQVWKQVPLVYFATK